MNTGRILTTAVLIITTIGGLDVRTWAEETPVPVKVLVTYHSLTGNTERMAEAVVEATLPHLPPVVGDMVRFQLLTGSRPGEVCSIRPCDVDRSGEVWIYRPEHHKTEHQDRQRIIFIGPKGQDALRPYLLRDAEAFQQAAAPRRDGQTPPEAELWRGGYSSKAMIGSWVICACVSMIPLLWVHGAPYAVLRKPGRPWIILPP